MGRFLYPVDTEKSKLEFFIGNYEKIYGRNPSALTPGIRFGSLIHRAHEQTGEKVVVILDEFDAAIMHILHQPKERDEMRAYIGYTPSVYPLDTSGTTIYKGTGEFRQAITGDGSGEAVIKIHYQCCNGNVCLAPTTKTIKINL